MYRNARFSSRMLFALPLAFAVGACGGNPSADEMTATSEQSLASASKPVDTGYTHPVKPAPSTKAAEALVLGGRISTGDFQTETAFVNYSASNTSSATVNTSDITFHMAAGETITLGTCGVPGASGSGDTFLRFNNASGAEVALSDDACGGVLSNFTYTAPAAGSHTLRSGCYSNTACSGTVAYSGNQVLFSYSASNTNSATVGTRDVYITLYPGNTYTFGTCGVNGASGSGDTYLRLFDPSGAEVAFSDDSCGALSSFSYAPTTYGTYMIRAGCYANTACSGTVAYLYQ